jgi:uncharacterized protein YbjT (DUF2867 family)
LRFAAIYGVNRLDAIRKRAYVPMTGNQLRLMLEPDPPKYSLCAASNAADAVGAAASFALDPGTYNVADPRPYSQPEVSELMAAVDGRRLTLSLRPATLRALMTAVKGVAPSRRRNYVDANVSKLLDGLVLDTAKLQAAGICLRTDLAGVLEADRG